MKVLILFIILSSLLSSCSLAPFSHSSSARSYGKGKMQFEVGNVNSTYNMKFGIGATENLDAGFVMEFGAISTSAIFLKYAMLNNETGLSTATEFGYGSTESTIFYYGGLVASLAFTKEFELFTNARINSVSTNESDIEKDKFNGNVKILAYDVNYLSLAYGMNLWFNENNGLSLYSVLFRGTDVETLEDSTFGASFLFNY